MKKLDIRCVLIGILISIIMFLPISVECQDKIVNNIKVVVLPFVCEESPELGTAFSDKLEIEFFRNDTVVVVSRSRLEIAISEQGLYNRLTGSLADVASQIGIEYIVSGSIVSHYVTSIGTKDNNRYTVIAKIMSTESYLITAVAEISKEVKKKELLEKSAEYVSHVLMGGQLDKISQHQNIGIDDTSDKNVTQPQTKTSPTIKFITYDDPPVPIGGYGAIYGNIVYPKIAQMAGTEGKVIIRVFIDNKGRVQEMNVLEGIADSGLNEAAMAAIKKTRFKPAQQRDRPVGVYISIPVNFKLKG